MLVILQVSTLLAIVEVHQSMDELFKRVSVTNLDEIGRAFKDSKPYTFCVNPPTNYTTIFIIALFANMLIIFTFLDAMDRNN